MTGKSELLLQMFSDGNREAIFGNVFHKILYCIPQNGTQARQDFLNRFSKNCKILTIRENLPSLTYLKSFKPPSLQCCVIFDDLFSELNKHIDYVNELLSQFSHHNSVSLVFVLQNLFSSQLSKLLIRQVTDFLLLNSKNQRFNYQYLCRQILPFSSNLLYNISEYCKHLGHRYIWITLSPINDVPLRFCVWSAFISDYPLVFDFDCLMEIWLVFIYF